MRHRKLFAFGLAALFGGTAWGQSTSSAPIKNEVIVTAPAAPSVPMGTMPAGTLIMVQAEGEAPGGEAAPSGGDAAPPAVAGPGFGEGQGEGQGAQDTPGYGPYPAQKEVYLQ